MAYMYSLVAQAWPIRLMLQSIIDFAFIIINLPIPQSSAVHFLDMLQFDLQNSLAIQRRDVNRPLAGVSTATVGP